MFIPASMGRLTGLKAVAVCVVLVGFVGLKMWAKMQPRSLEHGTVTVEADHLYFWSFTVKHSGTLKVELAPQGAAAASAAYTLLVLDEANHARYERSEGDLKDVQTLVKEQAVGPVTLPQLEVAAGTYYIIVENAGKTSIMMQYKFSEVPR